MKYYQNQGFMRGLLIALIAAMMLAAPRINEAAITFVAKSANIQAFTGTTSQALTLPTGYNTAGNITIAYFAASTGNVYYTSTIATTTAPSGWTTLFNFNGFLVCYRLYQSGDPSSITATSTSTSFFSAAAVTYSGVDATTRIDASLPNLWYWGSTTTSSGASMRAPSLNPNFNGSQLVVAYMSSYFGGGTLTMPGGLTSRQNSSNGPTLGIADLALTNGTPTGDYISTYTPGFNGTLGYSIALKASGAAAATLAAAAPELVATTAQQWVTAGAQTLDLTRVPLANNDYVIVGMAVGGGGALTPPAGYTSILSSGSGQLQVFAHQWLTGDTTSPSFSGFVAGFNYGMLGVARVVGVSTNNVSLDTESGHATSGTGPGAITETAPSLAPATASDLLLLYFSRASPSSGGTGAWSAITSGPVTDQQQSGLSATTDFIARDQNLAANPSGSFSATDTLAGTGSYSVASGTVLLKVASSAPKTQPVMILN